MSARLSNTVFIVALIILVAACSFKTLYNQLDFLIPSYVEGMVSLDEVLEEKVEQRTLILINWHRNTQLQQYANWMYEFQQDAGPQLTEASTLQHINTLESFWLSLSVQLNEEMALLLPLLDKEQRLQLFESITEKNEDFREDHVDVDDDERIEQYLERTLDTYETWLGDLTDEQQLAVKQAAIDMLSGAALRLERRLEWQHSIQEILGTTDSVAQKSERLREFFSGFDIEGNVALKAITDTNKQIIARLTVQIVHSMTDEQKYHLINKTNDYIRMLNELAEEQ